MAREDYRAAAALKAQREVRWGWVGAPLPPPAAPPCRRLLRRPAPSVPLHCPTHACKRCSWRCMPCTGAAASPALPRWRFRIATAAAPCSACPQALEAADAVEEARRAMEAAIAEDRFEGQPGGQRSQEKLAVRPPAAAGVASLRGSRRHSVWQLPLASVPCRCLGCSMPLQQPLAAAAHPTAARTRRRRGAHPGPGWHFSAGLVGGARRGGPLWPPAAHHSRLWALRGASLHPPRPGRTHAGEHLRLAARCSACRGSWGCGALPALPGSLARSCLVVRLLGVRLELVGAACKLLRCWLQPLWAAAAYLRGRARPPKSNT